MTNKVRLTFPLIKEIRIGRQFTDSKINKYINHSAFVSSSTLSEFSIVRAKLRKM